MMTNEQKEQEAFEAECPETIYLIDMGEDMPVWCEDGNPDYDNRLSVKYTRTHESKAVGLDEVEGIIRNIWFAAVKDNLEPAKEIAKALAAAGIIKLEEV